MSVIFIKESPCKVHFLNLNFVTALSVDVSDITGYVYINEQTDTNFALTAY